MFLIKLFSPYLNLFSVRFKVRFQRSGSRWNRVQPKQHIWNPQSESLQSDKVVGVELFSSAGGGNSFSSAGTVVGDGRDGASRVRVAHTRTSTGMPSRDPLRRTWGRTSLPQVRTVDAGASLARGRLFMPLPGASASHGWRALPRQQQRKTQEDVGLSNGDDAKSGEPATGGDDARTPDSVLLPRVVQGPGARSHSESKSTTNAGANRESNNVRCQRSLLC